MSCSSWRGEAPLLSFQNFLLENSHLPLKQVNVIMSLIWENSGHCAPPPPSVKFKVIKICFGHMTARCTAHAKTCARAVKLNSWQEARGVCLKLSLAGAANPASLQFSSLLPPSLISEWFMITFQIPEWQFVHKMIFREFYLLQMMLETSLKPGLVGQGCRFPWPSGE